MSVDKKKQKDTKISTKADEIEDAVVLADDAEQEAPDDAGEEILESETSEEEAPEAPQEDVDEDIITEPAEETAPAGPAIVETKIIKRGGFFTAFLGGVACAALGYGAAQFIKPEGWPFPLATQSDVGAELSELDAKIADQISALEEKQNASSAAMDAQLQKLNDQLAAAPAESPIEPLVAQLDALSARLDALENAPSIVSDISPEMAQALDAELASMRSQIDEEVNRLGAMQAQVQQDEAVAKRAADLLTLQELLDKGAPFEAVLAEFDSVPEGLTNSAAAGVPTQAALLEAFPDAARASLQLASQASYESGEQGLVENFLYTQLGLRSTAPKDGASADAILSRVEQHVKTGDLSAALAELAEFPEAAKEPLGPWMAQAQQRLTALDGLAALKVQ